MPTITKRKVIISGNIVEVYDYQFPVVYGLARKVNDSYFPVDEKTREEQKKKSQAHSIHRSRVHLNQLLNANVWRWEKKNGVSYPPVFLTLTFAENIQDTDTANLHFTKFMKRMTYFCKEKKGADLKYIAVIEFQKRGAVHYHIVFFNFPMVRKEKIAEIWGHGFIKIKKVKHVDNIGAYMSKYMTKAFLDKHSQGKKRYFASKGLKKPEIIINEKKAFFISEHLPENMFRRKSTYPSEYQGQVHYRQYNLGIGKTLSDFIDFPLE